MTFSPNGATHAPNVLVFNADDLGVGDLSFNGWAETLVSTPHVDRLAREGTVFTNMHAGAPLCAPSRYSILTGNLPPRGRAFFGTWSVGLGTQVEPSQLTTGHLFRRAGFATAFVGKVHLGAGLFRKDGGDTVSDEIMKTGL